MVLNVFLGLVNIDSWTTLMFNVLPRGNNNVYRIEGLYNAYYVHIIPIYILKLFVVYNMYTE